MTACIATRNFTFEGHSVPTLFIEGRPCWLARDIGTALGYDSDGKRLVANVTGDWSTDFIEGSDYAVFDGPELATFKSLGLDSVPSRAPAVTVLYESGINLACMLTRKPLGRAMRRWLADDVLPALHRTGQYAHPTLDERAPLRRQHSEAREARLRQREQRLQLRESRLDRERRAKAIVDAADAALAAEVINARVHLAHRVSAAEILADRSLPMLRPPVEVDWKPPALIARELGVSTQRVGMTVSTLGLRGNQPGMARAILNTVRDGSKTVTSYQYSPAAVELIRARLVDDGHLPAADVGGE